MSMPYWYEHLPNKKPVKYPCPDYTNENYESEIVIIGGGMSGLSCAYFLGLHGRKVIVLESRGICDGATGRNGGHQWPQVTSDNNPSSRESINAKIEQYDFQLMSDFISSLSPEWQKRIQWRHTGGMKVSLNENMRPLYEDYCNCVNSSQVFIEEKDLPGIAKTGIAYMSPAQFIPGQVLLALCEKIQNHGNSIWTDMEVTSVTKEESSGKWILAVQGHPLRIRAKYVVHCWNGYGNAEAFLPTRLSSVLSPVRGDVVRLVSDGVNWSKSLIYTSCEASDDEYLIQRGDGSYIFGGMRFLSPNKGVGLRNDSDPDSNVASGLQKEFDRFFETQSQAVVTHAWSGIMCFVDDDSPIVGEIEELSNQYSCVGFCGHGMVRTFACGQHIAELISGHTPLSCAEIMQAFSPSRFIK